MKDLYSKVLKFDVNIGTDKNYFIQSENGAFHVLIGNSPYSRCIIASPAGNAGCIIKFEGKSSIEMIKPLEIINREEVNFKFKAPAKEVINLASLGSIRVLRSYTEGGSIENTFSHMNKILEKLDKSSITYNNLKNWLTPYWEFENNNKTARIKVRSLNNKDWYEIILKCENGEFKVLENRNPSIGVNSRLQLPESEISITYKSSFKPLTPFPVKELLNEKALTALRVLPDVQKENAVLNLNALRFLAYKEKFLAGSWRFLTYFGRDTLLSLRMLAPIVTPEAFEAEFRGISEHLNEVGEIAHEEDLGDQSAIDQLNAWLKSDSVISPEIDDRMISDFISVDTNYLALPLLLDYYYIGGKKLFSSENPLFDFILKNINFVLTEASELKPVEIHKGIDVGDWRDSRTGLAFGRYAFSVNGAMVPAAVISIDKLISLKAWDRNAILSAAQKNNFKALENILINPNKLKEIKDFWLGMWKKFLVQNDNSNYREGFLSLSLDENLNPIPVIQSDTLFMLLDFPVEEKNNWLNPVCDPFKNEVPEGLMSDAGVLAASPVFAPEKFQKMFDNNHYHGQVVWAWQNLMLKIALQKQLNKWIIPSPSEKNMNKNYKNDLEKILARISEVVINSKEWSTSELWSWKFDDKGKVIPVAYGQDSANETESNAIQLWSAAALSSQLWDKMNNA